MKNFWKIMFLSLLSLTILSLLIYWPKVARCALEYHIGIMNYPYEKMTEVSNKIYIIYQAVIATLSLILALIAYSWGKISDSNDKFKDILVKELDHLFKYVKKYSEIQNELVGSIGGKKYESYFFIERLANKYRERELSLLIILHGSNKAEAEEANKELMDIDKEFIHFFNESNGAKKMADVLFNYLDWSWAVLESLKRLYSKEAGRKKEIEDFRETIIKIVRDYIGPNAQFIFGKYRHLNWELDDKLKSVETSVSKKYYRGENFADRLFFYERTLMLYKPSSCELKNLQLENMRLRWKNLELNTNLIDNLDKIFVEKWEI